MIVGSGCGWRQDAVCGSMVVSPSAFAAESAQTSCPHPPPPSSCAHTTSASHWQKENRNPGHPERSTNLLPACNDSASVISLRHVSVMSFLLLRHITLDQHPRLIGNTGTKTPTTLKVAPKFRSSLQKRSNRPHRSPHHQCKKTLTTTARSDKAFPFKSSL